MDGARLMNAVVASGIPAHEMVAGCDSVWVDFTKGLGAPLGAVLCGSEAFIDEAWRWKQRLGGSMRQAGVCAAACIYALDHNIDRLADDHANAKALARGLAQIPGVTVEEPETNLVFFDTSGQRPDRGRTRIERCGMRASCCPPWVAIAPAPARISTSTGPESKRRCRCCVLRSQRISKRNRSIRFRVQAASSGYKTLRAIPRTRSNQAANSLPWRHATKSRLSLDPARFRTSTPDAAE